MYMPCLARDSMTLMRLDVFRKPMVPCLQMQHSQNETLTLEGFDRDELVLSYYFLGVFEAHAACYLYIYI